VQPAASHSALVPRCRSVLHLAVASSSIPAHLVPAFLCLALLRLMLLCFCCYLLLLLLLLLLFSCSNRSTFIRSASSKHVFLIILPFHSTMIPY
jgi:hypothetical protein